MSHHDDGRLYNPDGWGCVHTVGMFLLFLLALPAVLIGVGL